MSKKKGDERSVIEDPIIYNYFQRFGTSASIGLLDPSFKVFSDSSIDGIIGYRLEHNCAVAFGDPLCASCDKIILAQAFNDFCKKHNRKNIFAMTSQAFTNEALACFGGGALQVGHEVIIDPTIDIRTLTGRYASHLRQKFNHAVANGLSAHEYKDSDPEQEKIFETIAKIWLSNRKGLQSFIQPVDVFGHRANKRWFYAKKDSRTIAFLMLTKLPACNGWMLNNGIMLTLEAPKSTSEFLVLHVIETLRNEGCTYFTNGPTLAPNVEQVEGFDWLSQMIVTHGTNSALKILRLNDRQRFWNKFQPHKEPSFMTFTSSHISVREALALLKAFNVGLKKQ